ncbi:hypothetical protein L544_3603 [Bordetella hinzii OH87 BAL007II]|uniref:Uncharacterized protein n=1 Tax=Bordetella hinzii OH87 BAL007II TaxID=1331262 RepID=A0ABR4R1G2_9BORD|nr:hypothetical protein L544_3603 [Bordetella hinzii OH87 BAL007II]
MVCLPPRHGAACHGWCRGGAVLAVPARQRASGDVADALPVGGEAQARAVGQRQPAGLGLGQPVEDLLADLDGDGVVLDEAAMRQAGVQVHVVEGPGPAVGDGDVAGLGHAGDAQALCEAAGDGDIGLGDVQRPGAEEVREARGQALVLPAGQRHGRAPAQVGQGVGVVLRQGFFKKSDIAVGQARGQLAGVVGVQAAIGVYAQLDVLAHAGADRTHPRFVLAYQLGQGAGFVAPLQAMVAHGHFQAREAALHPLRGRFGQLFAIQEIEAKGGVDGHAVARAAQQAPQRQAQALGLQVPQGDVDGGHGVGGIAALPARREQPIEFFPQFLAVHGRFAPQRVGGDMLDGGGHDFFFGDGREAAAAQAAGGVDARQHAGQRAAFFAARHRHGDLDVQGDGGYLGDGHVRADVLHDCLRVGLSGVIGRPARRGQSRFSQTAFDFG